MELGSRQLSDEEITATWTDAARAFVLEYVNLPHPIADGGDGHDAWGDYFAGGGDGVDTGNRGDGWDGTW